MLKIFKESGKIAHNVLLKIGSEASIFGNYKFILMQRKSKGKVSCTVFYGALTISILLALKRQKIIGKSAKVHHVRVY